MPDKRNTHNQEDGDGNGRESTDESDPNTEAEQATENVYDWQRRRGFKFDFGEDFRRIPRDRQVI